MGEDPDREDLVGGSGRAPRSQASPQGRRRGASVAGVSLSAEAIVLVLVPVITAALVVAMP